MADFKMPESQPCQFDNSWAGRCNKPSDNGWCSEHEKLTCSSCGAKAVRSCPESTSLVCGAPLCATCVHDPFARSRHVTREVAKKAIDTWEAEEAAKIASRTNPTQRTDEHGIPLNLHELLKGDLTGYVLKPIYSLELDHGLMGYFPAIFSGTKRVVVTTDLYLLERVWHLLPVRDAKLQRQIAYVNEDIGISFVDTSEQWEKERSRPERLLKQEEFDGLRAMEEPFAWASGLIGGGSVSRERFLKKLESLAKEHDPTFVSRFEENVV